MIKIVKTKVRPSIDIPFYEDINDSTEEYSKITDFENLYNFYQYNA